MGKSVKRKAVHMAVEGETAPDVALVLDDGTNTRLSALRGRPLVLYF